MALQDGNNEQLPTALNCAYGGLTIQMRRRPFLLDGSDWLCWTLTVSRDGVMVLSHSLTYAASLESTRHPFLDLVPHHPDSTPISDKMVSLLEIAKEALEAGRLTLGDMEDMSSLHTLLPPPANIFLSQIAPILPPYTKSLPDLYSFLKPGIVTNDMIDR